MDNYSISQILDFIDKIVNEEEKQQAAEINFVMELATDVRRCIEQNRPLLPYHLNVIDELHINENGHSRILCKLLQLKSKVENQMFQGWKIALTEHFPALKNKITLGNRGRVIFVGINLEIEGHPVRIVIDRDTNIYYGIYCLEGKDPKVTSIIENAVSPMGRWENNSSWYCWKYTDLESALPNLIELIEAIMPLTRQ